MGHKIELTSFMIAAFASQFATDLFIKIAVTTVSMVVGTTVAFYWKKHLEKKKTNKED